MLSRRQTIAGGSRAATKRSPAHASAIAAIKSDRKAAMAKTAMKNEMSRARGSNQPSDECPIDVITALNR